MLGTIRFLEKNVPGSATAPDKWFLQKNQTSFLKSSAPGSEAAPDKWFLQKNEFLEKVLPQAAKLPGTSSLFKKKVGFLRIGSAPGSEAAPDKWLLQKKSRISEKKFCPRQRSCQGQVASSKKSRISEKKFCPRQRSSPGQVASSKRKSDF